MHAKMTLPTLVIAVLLAACADAADFTDSGETGVEGTSTGDEDEEFRTYEGYLGTGLGAPLRQGSTVGKTSEFTPTCASSTASDVSYTWTAPATATCTFTTMGSSFDTILHIRSYTNSTQTLACNDDANGTLQSSVSLQVTQGTTLIIVVDGYSTSAGSFKLNISCQAPQPQCQPQGCQEWQCGYVSNGCGGVNYCGACEPQPSCFSLGWAGQCSPQVCCDSNLDCGDGFCHFF